MMPQGEQARLYRNVRRARLRVVRDVSFASEKLERRMRYCTAALAIVAAAACAGSGSAQEIYKREPPAGALRYGQIIYVDDGKCPKGQVKQVMGGYISSKRNFGTINTSRERKCVARP